MDKTSLWSRFWTAIGFLRPGWWIVHLAGISVVYALGHLYWR